MLMVRKGLKVKEVSKEYAESLGVGCKATWSLRDKGWWVVNGDIKVLFRLNGKVDSNLDADAELSLLDKFPYFEDCEETVQEVKNLDSVKLVDEVTVETEAKETEVKVEAIKTEEIKAETETTPTEVVLEEAVQMEEAIKEEVQTEGETPDLLIEAEEKTILTEENLAEEEMPTGEIPSNEVEKADAFPIEEVSSLEEVEEVEVTEEIETKPLPELAFSIVGWDAEKLRNLVFSIYSKGKLISKVTGGDFGADETWCRAHKTDNSLTWQNFAEAVSDGKIRGLTFEADRVIFSGFGSMSTDLSNEEVAIYREFFQILMNYLAEDKHQRVQIKLDTEENEKYAFRGWITRLGWKNQAPESKRARLFLYKKLTGHVAFRTPADEEKWKVTQKAKKEQKFAHIGDRIQEVQGLGGQEND